MKLFIKFVATIGIIWLAVIVAFGYWWDSSKSLSYKEAVNVLQASTKHQQREVLKLCIDVMSSSKKDGRSVFHSSEIQNPPIPFDFIRFNPSACHLFLYKNPGKGLGFVVTLNKDNKYELFQFNDYKSWERHLIDL